jgi:NAD(P)H-hydrate epimerase
MTFPIYMGEVPYLSVQQMVEVDRAMIEDYHIELIQMMENAGRNLAHLARVRFLDGNPGGKGVTVLAGTGSNGGGTLVCARRLHSWGARVQVVTTKPDSESAAVPGHQLEILRRMSVPIVQADTLTELESPQLIVDGVVGYSLRGAPRGTAAEMIRWANVQPAPILALDVPSGVEATTGTVFDPAIRATATMTLALPKQGFLVPGVETNVGELYLADICVPPALYASSALALQVGPIFAEQDIIRLRYPLESYKWVHDSLIDQVKSNHDEEDG